jgi:hypothetical protein
MQRPQQHLQRRQGDATSVHSGTSLGASTAASSTCSSSCATSCGIGTSSHYSGVMSDDFDVDFHEDDFEYDYWSGYTIDTNSNDTTARGNGAQEYTIRNPTTGPPLSTTPPLADSMIAHQLSHMSMQDQVYLDSHGVREKEVVETPLLVFESMEHMKVQLQQLVLHGRAQAISIAWACPSLSSSNTAKSVLLSQT